MENQPEKKDIFRGDAKFGAKEEIKTEKPELREGVKHIGKGSLHLLKGLKHLLLIKVPMNVFALLVIILGVFFATPYFNEPTINANVVFSAEPNESSITEENFTALLKDNCKTIEWAEGIITVACPVCEVCEECPEITCENQTRTEVIYRYRCSDGRITNTSDGCAPIYPSIESPYISEANDMTLSIDDIEYSLVTNTTYQIRRIDFTILNKKDRLIVPSIEVKVYEQWSDVVSADPNRIIKTSEIRNTIDSKTGFKASVPVIINFQAGWTIRLELVNTATEPDERLVSVTRKIII